MSLFDVAVATKQAFDLSAADDIASRFDERRHRRNKLILVWRRERNRSDEHVPLWGKLLNLRQLLVPEMVEQGSKTGRGIVLALDDCVANAGVPQVDTSVAATGESLKSDLPFGGKEIVNELLKVETGKTAEIVSSHACSPMGVCS